MAFSSHPGRSTGQDPKNYADCVKIWATKRRKLACNTYLVKVPHGYAVQLHRTLIVTFKRSGSVVLAAGGWHTNLTKERINRYLPPGFFVSSLRDWQGTFWSLHAVTRSRAYWQSPGVPFADGTAITRAGNIRGAGKRMPRPKLSKEQRAQRRRERREAMARVERAYHFTTHTLRNGLPLPARGEWLTEPGRLRICSKGLHASREPEHARTYAPDGWTFLHLVEVREVVAEQCDKLVARHRRIIATLHRDEVRRCGTMAEVERVLGARAAEPMPEEVPTCPA